MAKHKSKGGHVELPADVAVLPLRDVVVYPHMVIPLFVGREKSIRALDHATQNYQPILLVAQRSADVDDPGPDEMYEIDPKTGEPRKNPDGSFTQIEPPESGFPGDSWTPLAISDSDRSRAG